MKTLINKANPAIRMTAPEIEVHEEEDMYFIPVENYCIPMCIDDWKLVEEEPTCKESLQVEEEHPDNFTSFEWLIGRLMFRGCDLWGMTDGEDDNGIVTKLIKDRAAEMMELLERELDPNAEPVDLEKAAEEYALSLSKSSMGGKEYCNKDFKAGAEWQKKQFSDILDKWEELTHLPLNLPRWKVDEGSCLLLHPRLIIHRDRFILLTKGNMYVEGTPYMEANKFDY